MVWQMPLKGRVYLFPSFLLAAGESLLSSIFTGFIKRCHINIPSVLLIVEHILDTNNLLCLSSDHFIFSPVVIHFYRCRDSSKTGICVVDTSSCFQIDYLLSNKLTACLESLLCDTSSNRLERDS